MLYIIPCCELLVWLVATVDGGLRSICKAWLPIQKGLSCVTFLLDCAYTATVYAPCVRVDALSWLHARASSHQLMHILSIVAALSALHCSPT